MSVPRHTSPKPPLAIRSSSRYRPASGRALTGDMGERLPTRQPANHEICPLARFRPRRAARPAGLRLGCHGGAGRGTRPGPRARRGARIATAVRGSAPQAPATLREGSHERRAGPHPHADRLRRGRVLQQSGDLGDAFRRGAGRRAGAARGAVPVRGNRHRRRRRLRPDDRPAAAALLHLGPGLANGLANLHNARRAHTPLLAVVGDHATYHKQFDAPLESDIDAAGRLGVGLGPAAWPAAPTWPRTRPRR